MSVLGKIDNSSPFPYLEIENISNSFHPSETSFGNFLFQHALKGFLVNGVKMQCFGEPSAAETKSRQTLQFTAVLERGKE